MEVEDFQSDPGRVIMGPSVVPRHPLYNPLQNKRVPDHRTTGPPKTKSSQSRTSA
ncbi:hypothetical protein BDR03DRAFT_976348 [Suillus americanus]|nr:hypothetical protein BDR03DRAFT_976348 [Suillus americanus]